MMNVEYAVNVSSSDTFSILIWNSLENRTGIKMKLASVLLHDMLINSNHYHGIVYTWV